MTVVNGRPPTAADRNALRKAEQEAGPAVVQEVAEAKKKEQRATEKPPEEKAELKTGK